MNNEIIYFIDNNGIVCNINHDNRNASFTKNGECIKILNENTGQIDIFKLY